MKINLDDCQICSKKALFAVVVLAGCTGLLALSPLSSDLVLFEGIRSLADGQAIVSVVLPVEQRVNGFFINVAGIEDFTVLVNGHEVAQITAQECPRSDFAAIDLSNCRQVLKPGINHIQFRVHPQLGTGVPESFWTRIWVSANAWYTGSFHGHTTYSDGAYSVHEILQMVNDLGGRFWALTDHNTMLQNLDTAAHPVGQLQVIRGTEWTTSLGHANLLGLQGDDPAGLGTIAEMIDEASYRGALVQINHPCDVGMEWSNYPNLDAGIDMIEVFNNVTWFPGKSAKPLQPLAAGLASFGITPAKRFLGRDTDSDAEAVEWWQNLLAQGKTIAGVGNSDYHGLYPFEEPLKSASLIWAPSNHPDTILRYAKLGQTMICDDPTDSRLYLYADTNSDGRWDLVMGQHARITSGSRTIRFRLEVEDADALEVVYIYDKTGRIYSHTLWTGGDYAYEWSRTFDARTSNFMRVELRAELGADHEFCTNPIYVNYPDYELGPLALAVANDGWPDTLMVNQTDTLNFRLRNEAGVSPYRFGLAVACDTNNAEIVGWQVSGNGIGEAENRYTGGYQVLEWRGGFPWSNRLSAGTEFNYWLAIRPKRVGPLPVLFRSWADDRLMVIARNPRNGVIGPEGSIYAADTIMVTEYVGMSPNRSRPFGTFLNQPKSILAGGEIEVQFGVGSGDLLRSLAVLDGMGRIVYRFKPGNTAAGYGIFHWQAAGIKPGVYFLRLDTRRTTVVRKFVVLSNRE